MSLYKLFANYLLEDITNNKPLLEEVMISLKNSDRKIREICYRIVASKAIMLCLELELFEFLQKNARTLEEITTALNLNIKKIEALLAICCSEGIIRKKKNFYILDEQSKNYLCKNSKFYYGDFIKFLYIELDHERDYSAIKKAICHDQQLSLGNMLFEEKFYETNMSEKFAYAMHAKSIAPSQHWPNAVALNEKKIFIDLGGGIGTHSISVCNKFPSIQAIILEKGGVGELGRNFISKLKMNNRIKFINCDFFTDALPKGDVYFLSDILHDWDVEKCRELLRRIAMQMKDKDIIIVHEIFFNNRKTGPWQAAAYNLSMNIFSHGCQYSRIEVKVLLESVGLKNVSYRNTFSDWGIMIAEK